LIQKRAARLGKRVTGIDETTLLRLTQHSWPGNVRELENVIERAIVMTKTETLTSESLPPGLRTQSAPPVTPREVPESLSLEPLSEARTAFEKRYVENVLKKTQGNLSAAARLAGLDRSNFRRLLRRLEIANLSDSSEE
jgi:two-component system response regulator HydG